MTRGLVFFLLSLFAIVGGTIGYLTWEVKNRAEKSKEELSVEQKMEEKYANYDRIVIITTELVYTYDASEYLGFRQTEKQISLIVNGSGFLVDGKIITAKHVIAGSKIDTIKKIGDVEFDGETNKIKKATSKIRVGGISISPQSVFFVSKRDLAIIKLSNQDYEKLRVRPLKISHVKVKVGDSLNAWGFPSTWVPQLKTDLNITSLKDNWFVVNKSLDSGYSGGPIVDLEGNVVGIISRSEEKQSRILQITTEDLKNLNYQDYQEGMEITKVF